jgi:hypothetical protein
MFPAAISQLAEMGRGLTLGFDWTVTDRYRRKQRVQQYWAPDYK